MSTSYQTRNEFVRPHPGPLVGRIVIGSIGAWIPIIVGIDMMEVVVILDRTVALQYALPTVIVP